MIENIRERQAFVRWLIDLMKADKIIAEREISFIERMCADYSISQTNIENTLGMTQQEACEILSGASKEVRSVVVNKLKELSLSDGACSREEALLLMAVLYCLDGATRSRCRVLSFKSPSIDFVDSQVLFVESNMNYAINDVIQSQYRAIVNELRLGGFDFIYIPKLAEKYRKANRRLLRKIVKYLAPTISGKETDEKIQELSSLTTHNFKNGILKEKFDIDIPVHEPSLMIKIGNSIVNGNNMSDYLVYKITENVVDEVKSLIKTFLDYQGFPTITIRNYADEGEEFIYAGFYKTIFDLVIFRRGARCKITFNHENPSRRLVASNGEKEVVLNMGLAPTAFYEFLINESFTNRHGVSFANIGDKEKTRLRQRFEEVYHGYCGSRDNAPDVCDSSTRNPWLSIVRRAVNNCDAIKEKHPYLPFSETHKLYIPLDPALVDIH